MEKIIVANWKANLTPEKAMQWCDAFTAALQSHRGIEIVLAVPALCLERIHEKTKTIAGLSLAAQGVSPYPQGNYTGALPAAWLRGLAKYTLIGHRERRRYFHESVQDVAKQVSEALAEDLQPIVCVDRDLLMQQTALLSTEEMDRILWAFTPETTVALEMTRNKEDISAMVALIAKRTRNRPVLYGGGVTAENSGAIWGISGVAGLMLGQECLDAQAFAALVNQLAQQDKQ